MAGELVDGLPEGLRGWVESRADETGRSRSEVLARAVTVQRLLAEYDGPLPDPSALDATTDDTSGSEFATRLDETDERIDDLSDEFDGKLTDVRERVVQVKREVDAKADADHDHPDLRRSAEAAADVAAEVESVRESVADLEARFAAGFGNYEDVVRSLSTAVDDLDGKTTTLASVLADLRTRVAEADARRARREAAADLEAEANRIGVETASCGACGTTVHLGLLARPECPECGDAFGGVDPASGFAGLLGSATLVTGSPPDPPDESAAATDTSDLLGSDE